MPSGGYTIKGSPPSEADTGSGVVQLNGALARRRRGDGNRRFLSAGLLRKAGSVFFATNSAWWYRLREGCEPGRIVPSLNVDVEFNNRDIVRWLAANHNRYRWFYIAREIESARKNNHIFVTITKAGSIVGYIKVGLNNVYILDFNEDMAVPDGKAFIYDSFVKEELRGRNIMPYALGLLRAHLRKNGIGELFCHIPEWNVSSIRSYEKSGFERIARVRFLRLFRRKFLLTDFSILPCRVESLLYELQRL